MEAEARPSGPEPGGGEPPRVEEGDGRDEETLIRPAKKARTAADGEMRRVAEIVLVLSGMAGVRGRREPTETEVRLMAEARARLVEACKELSPKDLVGREAVGAVIEDLGLNWKVKDQRLGFRGARLSIKERVALSSKRKLEETKKFSVPSTVHSSQVSQPSFGHMAGSHNPSSNIRVSSLQSPSGVLPASSPLGHATSISSSVMHHPMTPEVRVATASAGLTNSGLGRDSPVSSLPRADRSHVKLEGAQSGTPVTPRTPLTQANSSASQPTVSALTWPMHSYPISLAKIENNTTNHTPVKVEANAGSGKPRTSQAARDQTVKPTVTHTDLAQIQSIHQPAPTQGAKHVQPSGVANNHSEIAKIVQKVLQPKLPECLSWTPPSREYMSTALLCQLCRLAVHEVETVVLCDSCEKGFHLRCLEAGNQRGIPRAEWHCTKCLALSNGKPLPPKYGRVMRSATPSKLNAKPARGQPSPQKTAGTVQKVNLEKAANGARVSQGSVSQLQNNVGMGAQKVNQERPENGANSSQVPAGFCTEASHPVLKSADQKISNAKEVQGTSNAVSRNDVNAEMQAVTSPNGLIQLSGTGSGLLSGSSDESSLQQNQAPESASEQTKSNSESDIKAPAITSDEGVGESGSEKAPLSSIAREEPPNAAEVPLTTHQDHTVVAEPVGVRGSDSTLRPNVEDSKQGVASENLVEASNRSKEPAELSSDGLQNVEWVGNALRSIEGKTYYQSCCVDGVTYEINDFVLLPLSQNRLAPSKLQAMWEDNKNESKWVSIKRCYLPGDFPEALGCPDASERNEVYESIHESCVMAGLIKGRCEVLPPAKFREKTEEQDQSGLVVQSVFQCKWFYDEVNRTFQHASS